MKNADGRVGPAGMENLPKLVEMLCLERGADADVPASPLAQWETFRALVNTRPPCSTSEEFLSLQDELLQDVIAWRGVTDAREVLPAAKDERLALWRGDITTLRADAIVNAANSQMLGCFVPGHFCIDNAIHTFAGVQLRLECARLMRAQGHAEPSGAAKVTDAFNLPQVRHPHGRACCRRIGRRCGSRVACELLSLLLGRGERFGLQNHRVLLHFDGRVRLSARRSRADCRQRGG